MYINIRTFDSFPILGNFSMHAIVSESLSFVLVIMEYREIFRCQGMLQGDHPYQF